LVLHHDAGATRLKGADLAPEALEGTQLFRVRRNEWRRSSCGVLPLPIDGEGCRLLARDRLAGDRITFDGRLGIIGWRSGTEYNWDSGGQASIFRETAAKRGKVTTQLFNEPLPLKLNRLGIALERAQGLVEMLLTGAEAALRLFVCRDLALNLNL
jgi:hypothetical protein